MNINLAAVLLTYIILYFKQLIAIYLKKFSGNVCCSYSTVIVLAAEVLLGSFYCVLIVRCCISICHGPISKSIRNLLAGPCLHPPLHALLLMVLQLHLLIQHSKIIIGFLIIMGCCLSQNRCIHKTTSGLIF